MNYHISTVTLSEFQLLIKDKNFNTPKGILYYLKNTFQKEILMWRESNIIKSVAIITKIEYNEIEKRFNMYIDNDIVDATINYKERNKQKTFNEKKVGITPLNLKMLSNSRNFYSQRLYEMLRQWSNVKKKTFTVNELKEKLLIADKYSSYYEFKRRVLKPSIEKINKSFNMNVKFIEEKSGKNISKITFIMNDFEPRSYDFRYGSNKELSTLSKVEPKELINIPSGYDIESIHIRLLNYNIKISMNTLKVKKEEYGENLFIDAIKILEDKVQDEKIKAPVRYLTGILENLKNKATEVPSMDLSNRKNNTANFTQRNYNMEKLEKLLLGEEDIDMEDLYE